MKQGIHPDYVPTTVVCSCGNRFETRSTAGGELHVELCNQCHPFFTGQQKFVDTGGRVQRFSDKFGTAADVLEREAAEREARRKAAEEAAERAKRERERKEAEKAARKAKYQATAPAEPSGAGETAEAAAPEEVSEAEPSAPEAVEETGGPEAAGE